MTVIDSEGSIVFCSTSAIKHKTYLNWGSMPSVRQSSNLHWSIERFEIRSSNRSRRRIHSSTKNGGHHEPRSTHQRFVSCLEALFN